MRNTVSVSTAPEKPTHATALGAFARCGWFGFGGPLVVLGMLREDLIVKRQLVTVPRFERALAVANLLPGPTAFQVIAFLATDLGGPWFAALSVLTYITPGVTMVWYLAALYQQYAALDLVHAIFAWTAPAAVAVFVHAGYALAKRAAAKPQGLAAMLASAIAVGVLQLPTALVLLTIGLVAAAWPLQALAVPLLAWLAHAVPAPATLLGIARVFFTTGALAFGGGPVIIPLLRQELVDQLRWLTPQQFIDALTVGQSNPGPVMATATFMGYIAGNHLGALIATLGVFTPGFVAVLVARSVFDRIPVSVRLERSVQVAFAGGIGAMLAATWFVARAALVTELAVAWACVCAVALWSGRVKTVHVLALSATIPLVRHLIGV